MDATIFMLTTLGHTLYYKVFGWDWNRAGGKAGHKKKEKKTQTTETVSSFPCGSFYCPEPDYAHF